ncbi:MAG: exo-alpha-sialidase [Clostridia bacterium]|nr:exo-alpha-sialidase [Clostridia bacterium]
MKVKTNWDYKPYNPFHIEQDRPEILAIRPSKEKISFEWAYAAFTECEVFYGETGKDKTCKICGKDTAFFAVENDKEYEFYIRVGGKVSITRLACSGDFPGIVINYLHPNDNAYYFSGRFLASPSIVRLPSGALLVSMDVFSLKYPQNLSKVFKSVDDGKTWQYVTDLYPCFWGTLFIHQNKVYSIACSKEYGDLLLGCSEDEGVTWSEPIVLGRGSSFGDICGFHKAPVPVLDTGDKFAIAVEYGCWAKTFCQVVYSVDKTADFLNVENWHTTGCVPRTHEAEQLPREGACAIEGNLVQMPDGIVKNILRYGENQAMVLCIDDFDSAPVFEKMIEFPFAHTKFHIQKYDGVYYACGNLAPARNVLALAKSVDGEHWEVYKDVLNYADMPPKEVGFQYPSFFIENGYAYILSRTGFNKADDFHNTNAITFHKVKL